MTGGYCEPLTSLSFLIEMVRLNFGIEIIIQFTVMTSFCIHKQPYKVAGK